MTAAVSTVSAAIVAISGVWFCSQVLAVDQAHQPGRAQLTAGAPIRLGLAAAQLRLFAA